MQPYIFVGDSTSTPNQIGGVQEPAPNATLHYTGSAGENAGAGHIGRYVARYDWFGQARLFWGTLDVYAQQHTVDAYRFELGNVGDAGVVQRYIDDTLNNIDNCLARRVAYGIGADAPAKGSGPMTNMTNATTPYPSLYPLATSQEPNKSNAGLTVAVIARDDLFTSTDMTGVMSQLAPQKVNLEVVAPRIGQLNSGVTANASYITTSDIFYDAILIGSSANGTAPKLSMDEMSFVMEAYSHGKAIAALGSSGSDLLQALGIAGQPGIYSGEAFAVTGQVLDALSGPVRFPQRFPTDDTSQMC